MGAGGVFNLGDNTLSALDVRSGALLRTVAVGSGFAWMAMSARTGHVFLASGGDGTISMLDGRTGAVLRAVVDTESGVTPCAFGWL